MYFNYQSEWLKFLAEQARLRKEYKACGMTDEQCDGMYRYDLEVFRMERVRARWTMEGMRRHYGDPYMEGYMQRYVSACFKREGYEEYEPVWQDNPDHDWMDEIEGKRLYRALKALKDKDRRMLAEYVLEGQTQQHIAAELHITQASVSRKLGRIMSALGKALRKAEADADTGVAKDTDSRGDGKDGTGADITGRAEISTGAATCTSADITARAEISTGAEITAGADKNPDADVVTTDADIIAGEGAGHKAACNADT